MSNQEQEQVIPRKPGYALHMRIRTSSEEKWQEISDVFTTQGRGMALEWIMADKDFMERLREEGGLKE